MEGKGVCVEPQIVIAHEESCFEMRCASQRAPDTFPAVDCTSKVIDVFDVASGKMVAHAVPRI
jgi:hypothetical protein